MVTREGQPGFACACGGNAFTCVEAGVSHRNVPNYAYALHRCARCGLVRTHPVPSEATYTEGDEATQARVANEAAYRGFARSVVGARASDECDARDEEHGRKEGAKGESSKLHGVLSVSGAAYLRLFRGHVSIS